MALDIAAAAERTPLQGLAGEGGDQRRGPTGGWAKGTPRKARHERAVPGTGSTTPCTSPPEVDTTGLPDATAHTTAHAEDVGAG